MIKKVKFNAEVFVPINIPDELCQNLSDEELDSLAVHMATAITNVDIDTDGADEHAFDAWLQDMDVDLDEEDEEGTYGTAWDATTCPSTGVGVKFKVEQPKYLLKNEEGLFWDNDDGWIANPRDAQVFTDTSAPAQGQYVPYPDVIISVYSGFATVAEIDGDVNVRIIDHDNDCVGPDSYTEERS